MAQNGGLSGANLTKLCGEQWRSLSGKQKLVYDQVAEKCRNEPLPAVCYKTFEGIQEYKKALGFPFMKPRSLLPVD